MTAPFTLDLQITGDVVERQDLLNGTRILTLEGRSADGAWVLAGGLAWNIGRTGAPAEGDITLTSIAGDEVFATVAGGGVREAAADDDAGFLLALEYDVDGGSGAYESATGWLIAEGALAGDAFRLALRTHALAP
ncbi:MAG: hypothetical protein KGK07_09260 [Chloroflexota bacterium]|nr:hypothetical protein [Chloroflexota bacterium]